MLVKKRRNTRNHILGNDIEITRGGFINTTVGAVLTSKNALVKARMNANSNSINRLRKLLASEEHIYKRELRRHEKASKHGAGVTVRRMSLRRSIARRETLVRKVECLCEVALVRNAQPAEIDSAHALLALDPGI